MSNHRAMILVAEPEEAVHESIQMVLMEEGYDCHVVTNTSSLLRAIDIHDSDMLIADISLIYDDVKEILSAMSKYDTQYPPVLVTITYERVRDMLDLMSVGISEYLLKPFQFEDLLDRVQRVLKHQQSLKN
ncbi:MAG: response regulator [Balneolaceae bacterium]|nr:response regulator [Balneolaceae bacterium]